MSRVRVAISTAAMLLAVSAMAFVAGCGSGSPVSKVVILGIDGMDWHLIDPLLKDGKLPNLAALVDRGVRADLRSLEPDMKSPIIWTTIATGKGPQKHGIADFLVGTDRAPLYNSNGWLARPVWDILSERGYEVGIVNWLVSWPAQPVNGYNVTERMIYAANEEFGDVERATYPDGLVEELVAQVSPVSAVTDEDVAPFLNGGRWRSEPTPKLQLAVDHLKQIYGADETILDIATHMLDTREQPDVLAIYVNGVDLACHFFWGHMDPSSVTISMDPVAVEACSEVIPRYYERMDGIIGEVLDRVDEDSTIILCSDHGFRGPYHSPTGLRLGIWMHRKFGVLVAAGPGIRTDGDVRDASVFDITPTLLALLGEPVARDMDGFVIEEIISRDVLSAAPVRYIETYERSSYAPRGEEQEETPAESAVDDAIKERLRSLGYIE